MTATTQGLAPKRSAPVRVPLAIIVGALAASIGMVVDGTTGFIAFGATAVFVTACVAYIGFAETCLAASLILVAPGVLGESSFRRELIGCGLAAFGVLITRPTRQAPPRHRLAIPVALLLVGLGLIILAPAQKYAAVPYVVFALISIRAVNAPKLSRGAFKVLAIIVLGETVSFAASLVTHFHLRAAMQIGSRSVFVYSPFTLGSVGGYSYIHNAPRMLLGTGEPGLNAFYLVGVMVFFLTSRRRSTQVWGLIATGVAAAFSQSTGVFIAVGAALAIWAVVALWRSRRYFRALLLAAPLVAIAPTLLRKVIEEKALDAATSVTDRHLFDAGSASAASAGNINLITTLGHNPVGAGFICVALILFACVSMRSPSGYLAFALFAATAVFNEPSQWDPGAWMILGMSVVVAHAAAASSREPIPDTSASGMKSD